MFNGMLGQELLGVHEDLGERSWSGAGTAGATEGVQYEDGRGETSIAGEQQQKGAEAAWRQGTGGQGQQGRVLRGLEQQKGAGAA